MSNLTEFFDAFRQANEQQPWPWPRSMEPDVLAFYVSAWPDMKVINGAFIYDKAVIRGVNAFKEVTLSIDIGNATVRFPEDPPRQSWPVKWSI